jgi:PqqA peptide cyclase
MSEAGAPPRPFGLLAELTYRCPLHCPYCSNPLSARGIGELETEEWRRVFIEASAIGVLHALLSGGEPLLRPDLPDLVEAAREAGLYTNLITSGLGFPPRAGQLKAAGLDSVQISFQSDDEISADLIAGARAHSHKLHAARIARDFGFPLSINVVLHRRNIDRIEEIVALAEELGAERLELANTQYYGWAFENRAALLPTPAQIQAGSLAAHAARDRLKGSMDILYVMPDYFASRPKPCMNGWGRRYLTVNPFGDVLPCPTATAIPGMQFENVRDRSIESIWTGSDAFNRFRGLEWMPEPCRSCDRREIDFGGCRCQAALLTGDPRNTDPACELAPHRHTLLTIVESESRLMTPDDEPPYRYRMNPSGGSERANL